jgi:hypothetical protein
MTFVDNSSNILKLKIGGYPTLECDLDIKEHNPLTRVRTNTSDLTKPAANSNENDSGSFDRFVPVPIYPSITPLCT